MTRMDNNEHVTNEKEWIVTWFSFEQNAMMPSGGFRGTDLGICNTIRKDATFQRIPKNPSKIPCDDQVPCLVRQKLENGQRNLK